MLLSYCYMHVVFLQINVSICLLVISYKIYHSKVSERTHTKPKLLRRTKCALYYIPAFGFPDYVVMSSPIQFVHQV